MKASEKYLVEFWIETHKVRRERRVPGNSDSKNIYFFRHELVDDLELSVSWTEFFRMFNTVNHTFFLKEFAGETAENPFDPWRNPRFVGISIRILPHNRQDYQLIEVWTQKETP